MKKLFRQKGKNYEQDSYGGWTEDELEEEQGLPVEFYGKDRWQGEEFYEEQEVSEGDFYEEGEEIEEASEDDFYEEEESKIEEIEEANEGDFYEEEANESAFYEEEIEEIKEASEDDFYEEEESEIEEIEEANESDFYEEEISIGDFWEEEENNSEAAFQEENLELEGLEYANQNQEDNEDNIEDAAEELLNTEYLEEEEKEKKSRKAKKVKSKKSKKEKTKENFIQRMWHGFVNMSALDRVIVTTGVAVVALSIVTGSVYVSARALDKQVSDFATVGTQLEGIHLIGEDGLLAVADAEQARIAAVNALMEEKQDPKLPQQEEEIRTEYEEEEYSKEVEVSLALSSIQKDLKIKFINKKSGKLIANVPFQVSIKDPNGETSVWKDDDLDGIIYKKGITPGNYQVNMEALSDKKYKDYTLPSAAESVEVKKEIEYKKVDIINEIKTEAEVNVSKEDTKVNETPVESKLDNTVNWVESTSSTNNYIEVDKSTIPAPNTLAYTGTFQRLASIGVGTIDKSSYTLMVGESFSLTAKSEGVLLENIVWTSSNPEIAVVDENGKVTAVSRGNAVIAYKANGSLISGGDAVTEITGSCNVTVNAPAGLVSIENSSLSVAVGGKVSTKASASNFLPNKELVYQITSNNSEIANATIDENGNITIGGIKEGNAVLTVTVNYKEGQTPQTAATASIQVTVTAGKTITLDKTAATVYINTPITLQATITNATEQAAITAESSDASIATVAVKGKSVVVTAIKEGTTMITVRCIENGEEVYTACAVMVKPDPKGDKESKLKDASGNQVYIKENNTYREAVYADYYITERFYIQSGYRYTGWQTLNGKTYYYDVDGKRVTGEQIIEGAKYTFSTTDGALITENGIRGIDVSKWNGTIDWSAVKKSGIEYVIIRCGYRGSSKGVLVEDPKYKNNIKGAIGAGLKVGIYFFSQAIDEAEAVEEASMVLELVKDYNITYPIFLDVEASNGRGDKIDSATRTAVCKAFCRTIQSAGYTAGIYANKSWLNGKLDVSQLNAYKIWLAQYATTPTYTGKYDMWQYQSTGKVSGISGNVDMNWSYLGY